MKNMDELIKKAALARKQAPMLANCGTELKNKALMAMADALVMNADSILAANAEDVAAAVKKGTGDAVIDRLSLNAKRIADMADGIRQTAALSDPIGEHIEHIERPNGLLIEKVRVPFGVIGIIYEGRPNVTADAAALALKSGNCVLLRGSASAMKSNIAEVDAMRNAIEAAGLSAECIQLITDPSHDSVNAMMRMRGAIDVIIPRGGAGLINNVVENSSVPVIETGIGNCHVYVDASAKYDMVDAIVINSKTQRPAVCNAMETLLVEHSWAKLHLKRLADSIKAAGVTLHGDKEELVPYCDVVQADESDWSDEYLSLDMAVKLVDGVDEAIAHITKYGTQHTECIITEDEGAAMRFMNTVDAAVVNHNASTRFTDGSQFGFGGEIGISTQKLHARGPMGLREMTTYKYLVYGNGQVRD